ASSLTDEEMDVADADLESDEIPTSHVPFRNANLLSMATSYAEATDSEALFIGAHSEDFSGYPDCRPAFFDAFQDYLNTAGISSQNSIWMEGILNLNGA
ncbi:MAG: ExsB, partial [uncultured archaeon A07HR67]